MLRVEHLESRDNPAPYIPGWSGPEEWIGGNFIPGERNGQIASVALEGGSVRLVILDGPRVGTPAYTKVLLDTILFDPNFRGGGHLHAIQGSNSIPSPIGDTLLVVPGVGGGPIVNAFTFDMTSGIHMAASFFAPYDHSFRGGLRVSSGDIDRDGRPEAFFLPADGGGPQLAVVDMRTFETELSIWVGDPNDFSGDVRFEPTGGTALINNVDYIIVQDGDVIGGRAESHLFPY